MKRLKKNPATVLGDYSFCIGAFIAISVLVYLVNVVSPVDDQMIYAAVFIVGVLIANRIDQLIDKLDEATGGSGVEELEREPFNEDSNGGL